MLLWLCNEEQTQQQLHQLIQLQHLQQKQDGTSNSGVSLNGQYLQQLIQQLTNSAGNNLAGSTASSTSFEFNKQDLEKIKSYLVSTLNIPPVVQQPAVSIVQTAQQSVTGDSVTIEKMDTASLATGNVGTGSAPETSNSGPDAGAQTQQSSSTPQQTQAPWVIIAWIYLSRIFSTMSNSFELKTHFLIKKLEKNYKSLFFLKFLINVNYYDLWIIISV